MTPYQFAKESCANFHHADGSCLGIPKEHLLDHGQTKTCSPLEACLLASRPISPCVYFEEVVMPLADYPSPKTDEGLQSRQLKAREAYLEARKQRVPDTDIRICPDCDGPLAKRQRYCTKCSRRRDREAKRKAAQNRRGAVES